MGARRKPDSLTSRVEAFFEANPDEELTLSDAAIKFGATRDQLSAAMRVLANGGRATLEIVTLIRAGRGGAS